KPTNNPPNFQTPRPNLFTALGQVLGIGVIAPLYCFLHYTLSPIENFSALDQRLTSVRSAYAALPAVLLTYLVPFYLTLHWPGDLSPTRQALLFVWQLYPVWLSLVLWALSRLRSDTMATDKISRTQRDLPIMRWSVGGASALAAGVWWWAWMVGGYGLREVFVPVALPRSMASLAEFTAQFLRWDQVFGFGSHLLWLAYLFWDLASAGMLKEGWATAVGLGLGSVFVVGPGATVGLGWLWREHILATRRHKAALTPESVGRLHGASC
ncbi:hypothetical protein C8A00DRAFT_19628, partial [Chaetomidium leptoderma]